LVKKSKCLTERFPSSFASFLGNRARNDMNLFLLRVQGSLLDRVGGHIGQRLIDPIVTDKMRERG